MGRLDRGGRLWAFRGGCSGDAAPALDEVPQAGVAYHSPADEGHRGHPSLAAEEVSQGSEPCLVCRRLRDGRRSRPYAGGPYEAGGEAKGARLALDTSRGSLSGAYRRL